jgi:hypothetical protein
MILKTDKICCLRINRTLTISVEQNMQNGKETSTKDSRRAKRDTQ